MSEDFLHYLWKYKLFSVLNVKSTLDENVQIIKSGSHNFNSGPDFLNAHIRINKHLWIGNVEIHLKSSDWYLHKHESDANYDAVILHVVWEHDASIYTKNNSLLPTVILKDIVDKNVLSNYMDLSTRTKSWIPCNKAISQIETFEFSNWKERLFFERLQRKSNEMNSLLRASNENFEAVLFQLLAKNFGLKVNADAFLNLANSFDYSVLKKVSSNEQHLSALLFGQAGFLERNIENEYFKELKTEYLFLRKKFNLLPLPIHSFSFFRMRPSNFPTLRIAQLASLFSKHQNLFSKLMNLEKLNDYYTFFNIDVAPFWKTHFNFESNSKKTSKKLTNDFVDLLLVNTIIPLKFLYQRKKGVMLDHVSLSILKAIKPEKNTIISKFMRLEVPVDNAFDTQALLELKNNYCDKKRCLSCAVGLRFLKS